MALVSIGIAILGLGRTQLRLVGLLPLAVGLAAPLLIAQPDVLVSADGRLIGARLAGGEVALQARGGVDKFTRDAWLTMWGAHAAVAMPEAACGSSGCRLELGAGTAWVARGEPDAEACDADAVVSAEPVRRRCGATPVVDRFTVWREGATAIRLGADGATVTTSRASTGTRPWSPPAVAARTSTTLPMAAQDTGAN